MMSWSNFFFSQQSLYLSPYLVFYPVSVYTQLNAGLLCAGGVAVILYASVLFSPSASQNDHPATDRQAEDPAGQSERIPS